MDDWPGWHFMAKEYPEGFTAFAKRTPFVAEAHILFEPGDMWFEFGATKDEAMRRLRASLRAELH